MYKHRSPGAFITRRNMEMKDKKTIKIIVDTSELDQIIEKAERFSNLMNEATELADSIAHTDLNIRLSTVSNGNTAELASITTK